MIRRRLLYKEKESIDITSILPSQAEACDVVFANKSTEEVIIVREEKNWPSADKYEPIGVVVVPGEHGVLKDNNGNNQCGVMSIVPMSCANPNAGGNSNEQMYWGVYNSDISGLKNYTRVVATSKNTSNVATGFSDSYDTYLPRQGSIGGTPSRRNNPYAPSPYIGSDYKSGGYNESYGTTEFDTTSDFNALADFDGPGNTKKIIQQRGEKDYSSWKPTINTEEDYPAASCCDMFHTIGTKQNDWYLPAAGELGYILPRLYDINDTILKLSTAYDIGVQLHDYSDYWVSSEEGKYMAYRVYTSDGNVYSYNKKSISFVRAFLRLSDNTIEND